MRVDDLDIRKRCRCLECCKFSRQQPVESRRRVTQRFGSANQLGQGRGAEIGQIEDQEVTRTKIVKRGYGIADIGGTGRRGYAVRRRNEKVVRSTPDDVKRVLVSANACI